MAFEPKKDDVMRRDDDIAVARAQIRRLTVRVENVVIPAIAKRHEVARLTGESINLRYSDAELVDLLRSELALKIEDANRD